MSLLPSDADILRMYGFTQREINEFDSAVAPDGSPQPDINLSSPVWQEVLLRRQTLVGEIADQYYRDTGRKIRRARLDTILNSYYNRPTKSPWDWLKLEYRPKKTVDFIPASVVQARRKAKRRIANWERKWR